MANFFAYLAGLLSGIILTVILFVWVAWRLIAALPVFITSKQVEAKPEPTPPPGVN